jgi:hypothetical protein
MGNCIEKEKKIKSETKQNNEMRIISRRDSVIIKNDIIIAKQKNMDIDEHINSSRPDKYKDLEINPTVIVSKPTTLYNNLNIPHSPGYKKISYSYNKINATSSPKSVKQKNINHCDTPFIGSRTLS